MQTRKVIALLVTAVFLSSMLSFYAFSPDLSFNTVVMEGTMNSEASFIIFKDGSTYYARNGGTGIVVSNTNFSDMLMDCIQTTPYGELIYIKNSATPYIADTGILVDRPVNIKGEGLNYGDVANQGKMGTVIQFDSITNASEIYLFEFNQSNYVNHIYFASISDICLDANRGQNTMSWATYIHGQVSDLMFNKVWFKEGGYGGIKIRSEASNEVWNLWFRDCLIENNDGGGFDITSPSGTAEINRIHIVDNHFYDNWDDIVLWGVDDSTRRRVHDITIRGNTFDTTDRDGIKILNASRITIIGNHMMDVGAAAADTYSGVFLDDASNVTIMGNVIGDYMTATTKYAVCVNGTSSHVRVVGNILGNCTTAATYEAGTTVDVEFEHNTAT